tara:strand:+ start:10647 stop:11342 length:696 start_codon:yes stop_codon:yes gene_type:complete
MGGGGSRPKPPDVIQPPPPARDIDVEYVSPTMVQELARRQKQGAFVTKGQSLGQEGQVLGAKPTELANIQQASGIGFNPALGNLSQIFSGLQTPEEFFAGKSETIFTTMSHTRRSKRSLIDLYNTPAGKSADDLKGQRAQEYSVNPYTKAQVVPMYQSYQLENLGLLSFSQYKEKFSSQIEAKARAKTSAGRKIASSTRKLVQGEEYQKYYDDMIARNREYRSQQRQGMII